MAVAARLIVGDYRSRLGIQGGAAPHITGGASYTYFLAVVVSEGSRLVL